MSEQVSVFGEKGKMTNLQLPTVNFPEQFPDQIIYDPIPKCVFGAGCLFNELPAAPLILQFPMADKKTFHFAERFQGGITYDPIPKCDFGLSCVFSDMLLSPPIFHLFLSSVAAVTVLGLSVALMEIARGVSNLSMKRSTE